MYGNGNSMSLMIELQPSWSYVDGKKVPYPKVTKVDFRILNQDDITVKMQTKDVGPLLIDASIQVFKPIFIDVVLPILNGGIMEDMVNTMIMTEINTTKGKMPMGMLEGLLYMIPNNNIKIPDNIYMTYALAQG